MNYQIDRERGLALVREALALPVAAIPGQNVEYLTESLRNDLPDVIYPYFHALRAEKVTRNRTFYKKEALEGNSRKHTGIYSMLRPYPIPYIKDHATGGWFEQASEIFGRAVNGFMVNDAMEGAAAAATILSVPHPYAIEQILNGNWRTVSMGSSTHEVNCSICNADLIKEPCDHSPYRNEDFYAIIGAREFRFREISNVLMPSDVGAQLVATDVDPKNYRLYAANPKREHVYDVTDPTRANMLEHLTDENRQVITSIHQDMEWLLDEFRASRVKHYAMRSSTPHEQKESAMLISALPNEAFGLIYADETSRKTVRRFPMPESMTPDEKAQVKAQILAAKDITPEQREALLARLESGNGETIGITINAENYIHLIDVIDGIRLEMAAVSDPTPEPATTTDVPETPEPAATTTEAVVETPEPVVAEGVDARIVALEAALSEERTQRVTLMAGLIANYQVAHHDHIATGKTSEQLQDVYARMDAESLAALFELYREGICNRDIDVTNVETVENPVEGVSAEVTAPVVEPPVSSTSEPKTDASATADNDWYKEYAERWGIALPADEEPTNEDRAL